MRHEGRNIKLLIAYDGTDFYGWQRQGESPCRTRPFRTVQEEIELALKKMHGTAVQLTGAGRTDTGVHAIGQAANFYTSMKNIPADRFAPALNALLPHDVRIISACETTPEFHARFSACWRTYRYHFICRRQTLPHENRYNLQLWRFPELETLNAYGRLLTGEIDCSIFASIGDPSKSKNRYIYNACFFIEGERLIFEIRANAFLRKMVRSIAGTFLHYEEKGTPPEKLREIIDSGDRSLAGATMPPQGLFLWKVGYGTDNC